MPVPTVDTGCHCGSETLVPVIVPRPDGTPYQTQFEACASCGLMYWRQTMTPADVTREILRAASDDPRADD